MSLLRGLVSRALVLTLAVLYGLAVLVRILVGMVQLGPSKLFGRKKRSQPPECLQDPSLGTHAYVHLQVGGWDGEREREREREFICACVCEFVCACVFAVVCV